MRSSIKIFFTIQQKNFRNRESSGRTSIQSRNCGQLKISLQYDEEKFKLLVDIVCAKYIIGWNARFHSWYLTLRNLKPSSDSYNQLDSYVSAKLVAVDNTRPATAAKRKRRTNVVQNSLDPAFNSRFVVQFLLKPKFCCNGVTVTHDLLLPPSYNV